MADRGKLGINQLSILMVVVVPPTIHEHEASRHTQLQQTLHPLPLPLPLLPTDWNEGFSVSGVESEGDLSRWKLKRKMVGYWFGNVRVEVTYSLADI